MYTFVFLSFFRDFEEFPRSRSKLLVLHGQTDTRVLFYSMKDFMFGG